MLKEKDQKMVKLSRDLLTQRRTVMQLKQEKHEHEQICQHMFQSSDALTNFVKISEKYRKKFSDQLR